MSHAPVIAEIGSQPVVCAQIAVEKDAEGNAALRLRIRKIFLHAFFKIHIAARLAN